MAFLVCPVYKHREVMELLMPHIPQHPIFVGTAGDSPSRTFKSYARTHVRAHARTHTHMRVHTHTHTLRARFWHNIPLPPRMIRRKLPSTERHPLSTYWRLLPTYTSSIWNQCFTLSRRSV
jgi:hypothetical protein